MKRPPPGAGRTPLFQKLRLSAQLARKAAQLGTSDIQALVDEYTAAISRRSLLKGLASTSLAASAPALLSACSNGGGQSGDFDPRVVIVGAGMAGLSAAYTLSKAGIKARLFEGSERAGGRIYTARNLLAPGITTELGGEFIDSIHDDMITLAQEFGLELLDTRAPSEAGLAEGYFFDGVHYTEAQVIEAFLQLVPQIDEDYNSTGEIVDFENEGNATALDNMSISAYLDRIGATGFLRKLLDVAYVTEYGLDADQQSALNLIFLIGTDASAGFQIFGESDERYKIAGGNDRIIQALESVVGDQIQYHYLLESVRDRNGKYELSFQRGGGRREVSADIVLLTVPFSVLRSVDLDLELPAVKQKAIDELGYGTNSKVFVGCNTRIWRSQGFNGGVYTDQRFQLGWDSSRLQPGEAGGFTFYSGGALGVEAGKGSVDSQVERLLPGLELAFPGVSATLNGKRSRFFWPGNQFTLGSYAAYKPGQWTTIAGSEIVPVGGVYFAGEHCSYDYQGYMNGAAETGRRAAESILALLGAPSA